jgi:hypothetical protein
VKGNTGKMYRLFMIICTVFQNSKMGQIEGMEKILFCGVMVVQDLKRMQMTNRWDPILEGYTKGDIPERYFWMFKIGVRKRKRL